MIKSSRKQLESSGGHSESPKGIVMFRATPIITATLLCFLLTACGGGGNPDPGTGLIQPDGGFRATLTAVPEDGAWLCGWTLLQVEGIGLHRVELLVSDPIAVQPGTLFGSQPLLVLPRQFLIQFEVGGFGSLARLQFNARQNFS